MSEEEKKAIANLIDSNNLSLIGDGTIITSNKTIATILNLIQKQQEQLQEKDKVIDLIASEIVEFTGSCPLDAYDYEGIDCENKCDTGIEKQCFIEYFTKKAREV